MYILGSECKAGRVLGLDFGLKRIGLALSDTNQRMASPLKTIENKGWNSTKLVLKSLQEEYDWKTLLVGWPVMLNGEEGRQCKLIDNFCNKFYMDFGADIIKWDERMSSKYVTTLNDYSSKKTIDHLVATQLLQEFLNYLQNIRE